MKIGIWVWVYRLTGFTSLIVSYFVPERVAIYFLIAAGLAWNARLSTIESHLED